MIGEISLRMFIDRLQKNIETVNSYPDNTLIKVPEEEVERVTIEVGSDLDRQYWLFADWLLRSPGTRRVSPAVREAYEKVRSSVLVSPPSLLLHHEIYNQLKREIPLLEAFDNPEYFQGFLDIATEKGGREKIYNLLAGRELEDPISMRLVHGAQKLEGLLGIPSRGIEVP